MKQQVIARVLRTYAAVALAGLFALSLVALVSLANYSRDRTLTELETLARLVARVAEMHSSTADFQSIAGDLVTANHSLVLLANDGAPIAGTRPYPPIPATVANLASLDQTVSGFAGTLDTGTRRAYAIAPTNSADGQRRLVYMTHPLGRALKDANRTAIVLLSGAAAISVIVGLFIYRSLRWVAEPIYSIQAAARRYANGDLSTDLRIDGPPELQSLAEDLNRMSLALRRRIGLIGAQRNRLEVILASMIEGVIVLDERRGILSMNRAAGRLLGIGSVEATGRTLIEYLRNAQLDELAEQAYLSDQPSEHTITIYRGYPLHLQVHASPLRGDDLPRPVGSLLVISDVTRLQHLEELRKDFVANVSHELKTPITSIKGFVETLLEDDDLDPQSRQRFLNIILNHTNRLHLIIEDLLSLSRLEQGDDPMTLAEFALPAFVAETVDLSRRAAEEKQITLTVTTSGEPTAWGNPNLLEQALANLLDNAIKYSPTGSGVEVVADNNARGMSLRVIDHGIGIHPHDVPRIFERFYRTDAARSRDIGGTGLGLAIVKHIARAHGGEVSVRSISGRGSTFLLEIPRIQQESSGDAPYLR